MSIEKKTNFEIWVQSFQDETTFPSNWRCEWGQSIELWPIEKKMGVELYYTKTHIIHRVNEDMLGRAPIWHVWNRYTDKHIYCGSNQKQAYYHFYQQIAEERENI